MKIRTNTKIGRASLSATIINRKFSITWGVLHSSHIHSNLRVNCEKNEKYIQEKEATIYFCIFFFFFISFKENGVKEKKTKSSSKQTTTNINKYQAYVRRKKKYNNKVGERKKMIKWF